MTGPPSDEGQLHLIEEGQELVVYRNVVSDDRDSAELLDSLRSNAERGRPPRGQEHAYPLIHSGISTWDQREKAVANGHKFPVHGEFVAEIRLDPASGARFYVWGSPGHLTVWGEVLMIRERIVDIVPL